MKRAVARIVKSSIANKLLNMLARAFSSEVETGSRKETRQNIKLEPGFDSINAGKL
jgi:hypothetical protein